MISKLPPHHTLVETTDGSFTFFSNEFQEACHSTSGAKTETLLHYIQGCKIDERVDTYSPFIILEVGFGLGVGFLTTLEALKDNLFPWHFISLEIDRELLNWFQEKEKHHPILKNLEWKNDSTLEVISNIFRLTILCGDARKTLPQFIEKEELKWHAVYQDAFSPRRNPILWTKEWFEFLKKHSHQDVILSTYSASSSIRKSLCEAGWAITKGEKFGPKRSSTRATLKGTSDPEIIQHLNRSPVPALSDDNIELFLLE